MSRKKKPKLSLTYDGHDHVFLEVQKYVENNRTKERQTFNRLADLCLVEASGWLEKREGSSLSGFYMPLFRFREIENEVYELYTVVSGPVPLKLEPNFLKEVVDSWPDASDFQEVREPDEFSPEEEEPCP